MTPWHDRSVLPQWLSVDSERPDPETLRKAVDALAAGEVVAFPTDRCTGWRWTPGGRTRPAGSSRSSGARPAQAAPLIAADSPSGRAGRSGRDAPRAAIGGSLVARPAVHRAGRRRGARPATVDRGRHRGNPGAGPAAGATARSGLRTPYHSHERRIGAVSLRPRTPPPWRPVSVPIWPCWVDGGPAPGGPPSTIVDARGDAPVLVREGGGRVGPRATIAGVKGSAVAARHAVARERAALVPGRRVPDRTQFLLAILAADAGVSSHLVDRFRRGRAAGAGASIVKIRAAVGGVTAAVLLLGGCAARVPVVTTEAYPDFVFPEVPSALATGEVERRQHDAWAFLQVGQLEQAERRFAELASRRRRPLSGDGGARMGGPRPGELP